MSFKVKVIPEDPTNNGYMLKPLVTGIMGACGKPNARVDVLTSPRAQGYNHVKQLIKDEILDAYAHYDLLLFLPDADGRDREDEFRALEQLAGQKNVRLLCCAAVQEVEAWLLAGHVEKLGRPWSEVRGDVSVKENFFQGFLAHHGDPRRAGGGRDLLMKETLNNYGGLVQRCPELGELQQRISDAINKGKQRD